jgi:SAM-dependent methyltransferase
MNPVEYDNIAALEQDHWYYTGKRTVVRRWLDRVAGLKPDDVLLDCGAGTGFFAKEMEARCRVLVLDDHEESLRLLRTRFKPEQILGLAGDRIPLPDRSVNCVTALDVLEHIKDDAPAVREFHRLLVPGGTAVVTVPASMALWSDWDEGLHHFRRYDRRSLCALFPERDWEIAYVNYTNVIIYPAVWVVRKWRRKIRQTQRPWAEPRTEDRIPSWPWNGIFRALFVSMASWPLPFPCGVSLVLVARRKG